MGKDCFSRNDGRSCMWRKNSKTEGTLHYQLYLTEQLTLLLLCERERTRKLDEMGFGDLLNMRPATHHPLLQSLVTAAADRRGDKVGFTSC